MARKKDKCFYNKRRSSKWREKSLTTKETPTSTDLCKDPVTIEQETRGQAISAAWRAERAIRLTASNFGTVLGLRKVSSTQNCVNTLRYGTFCSKNMQYGKENESKALEAFTELYVNDVDACGLFVDSPTQHPYLAASPDGLVRCENALVEVRCLSAAARENCASIEDAIDAGKVKNCKIGSDGTVELRPKSHWFSQIQGQLNITGRLTCYLILYTPAWIHVIIVKKDEKYKIRKILQRCVVARDSGANVEKAGTAFGHSGFIFFAGAVNVNADGEDSFYDVKQSESPSAGQAEHDASPKPLGRCKEKRGSRCVPIRQPLADHVNRANHANKGKQQRDRRKLREKRRSTGVVHLQSTESTGGSTGEDEDEVQMSSSVETKTNTVQNEQLPEIPDRVLTSKTFHQRRNKSPSDLDADYEDNQTQSDSTPCALLVQRPATPTGATVEDRLERAQAENRRLLSLLEDKDKKIVNLETKIRQFQTETNSERSRLRAEIATLMHTIAALKSK